MQINKDDLLEEMARERNCEVNHINQRIAKENGRIDGIDYMLQRLVDYFNQERPEDRGLNQSISTGLERSSNE